MTYRLVLAGAGALLLTITNCGGESGGNDSGTGNTAGSAGASGSSSGGSGTGGSAGSDAGSGATSGSGASGGSGGSAGSAASAGSGASGGTGASSGSGGSSGAAGGTAGSGASGGSAGSTGGSAGAGGSGGSAGSGGSTAGSGGSTAGSGGSGGSTAGSGGSGGSPQPECDGATDACTLHSDCCNCLALAPGETAPKCTLTCIQNQCEALAITTTSCIAGQCSAGYDCDPSVVLCLAPQPNCGAGMIASVRGSCWGPCVPAEQCRSVPTCATCPVDTICVANRAHLSSFHCVPTPPCNPLNCTCAGDLVCTGSFSACSDTGSSDGSDISCGCPAC